MHVKSIQFNYFSYSLNVTLLTLTFKVSRTFLSSKITFSPSSHIFIEHSKVCIDNSMSIKGSKTAQKMYERHIYYFRIVLKELVKYIDSFHFFPIWLCIDKDECDNLHICSRCSSLYLQITRTTIKFCI